jgi:hypothetical protein
VRNSEILFAVREVIFSLGEISDTVMGTVENNLEDGLVHRVGALEKLEKEREENIEERKETYWKPFIGGITGGISSLVLAWIISLL